MNNKTVRWLTNLLLCIGTGFMVTGMAAMMLSGTGGADTWTKGAWITAGSLIVIVLSYVAAMQEKE